MKKYFLALLVTTLFAAPSFGANPALKAISGISTTNLTTLCAVGLQNGSQQSTIIKSNDYFTHWTSIYTSDIPLQTDLYTTSIAGGLLWIAGNQLNAGRALNSNNWGASWVNTTGSDQLANNSVMGIALDSSNPLKGIVPEINASRGMPGPASMYYSINETSVSWQPSLAFSYSNLNAAASGKKNSTFWAVGDSALVLNSSDGGKSWTSIPGVTLASIKLSDICFYDSNYGFMTGSNSAAINQILYTTDGGNNWKVVDINDGSFDFNSGVYFINPTTGWICTGSQKVYKLNLKYSTNPATVTVTQLSPTQVYPTKSSATPTARLNRIFALDENNVFTVCDDGSVYAIITPIAISSVVREGTNSNQAPAGYNGNLTITGTNFQIGNWTNNNVSFITNGGIAIPGFTVNSVTRNSSSQLTASVTIAPNASPGICAVTVNNIDGSANTLLNAFTINPLPAITSVAPPSSAQGTTINLTVNGSDFQPGITAAFSGTGITINNPTLIYQSPTKLIVNITIDPNAATASRTFTLTNPDSGSTTSSFTVNASPTISSIDPPSGMQGTSPNLIVKGTGFQSSITANFGPGIINSVSYQGSTLQFTVSLTIDASAATGPRTVTFTNPDGGSVNTSFTVSSATAPNPSIDSVSPGSLPQGASNQNLIITGTNFESGATVVFSGSGITINSPPTVNSSSQLTVIISVASNATTGQRTITITNLTGGSGSANNLFYITTSGIVNPTINSVTPSLVYRGTAQIITINGTGFKDGAAISFNPSSNIVINSNTFLNSGQIEVLLTADSAAALGRREIDIANPDGGHGSLTNAIEIVAENPPPTITDAVCYPNPYNPNAGPATLQLFLTQNALVEINLIDISGTQRMSFTTNATVGYNKIRWDGKDYSGNIISNGVIIGIIKTDGKLQKQKFKIMVQNK